MIIKYYSRKNIDFFNENGNFVLTPSIDTKYDKNNCPYIKTVYPFLE